MLVILAPRLPLAITTGQTVSAHVWLKPYVPIFSEDGNMQARFRPPPKMAPSSSGPGRQVLILKIRGSTPLGVTKMFMLKDFFGSLFVLRYTTFNI
jgi:hypothetical protein